MSDLVSPLPSFLPATPTHALDTPKPPYTPPGGVTPTAGYGAKPFDGRLHPAPSDLDDVESQVSASTLFSAGSKVYTYNQARKVGANSALSQSSFHTAVSRSQISGLVANGQMPGHVARTPMTPTPSERAAARDNGSFAAETGLGEFKSYAIFKDRGGNDTAESGLQLSENVGAEGGPISAP